MLCSIVQAGGVRRSEKGVLAMSLEENKALVCRFIEEVQCRHNLAALDEYFSPDFVDHAGIADPPDLTGARVAFAALVSAFPDHRMTVQQQFAEGNKVVTYKRFDGTHLGTFHGIQATGRAVSFELIDIFAIVNGKITEHWAVMDNLSLLQQLGAA
jgi:predicted ester cyclase